MNKIVFIASILLSFTAQSQTAHKLLRSGDKHYSNEQFDLAEEAYRKAKEKGASKKGAFNLGNSLYEQERYEEAVTQYQTAAANTTDSKIKSDAYYNLGNAQVKNEKLKEGIESYKRALEYNANNEEAISNMLMSKMLLQKQQQQRQQQQQQQQSNQDQSEEQEQQSNEEQQQQQQPSNEQQQSEQEQENKESEEEKAKEEKKDLDKEDARKLLEIIDSEEKKVQEKLRKMSASSKRPKKDW